MDAKDFLTSAAQKMMGGNQKVDYRNAVSRAYYSVFHVCKNLLEKLPNSPPQNSTFHQKLIDGLLSHPDRRLTSLGHQLARARDWRTQADYLLNEKVSRHNAERLLTQSKDILATVEKYLSESKR